MTSGVSQKVVDDIPPDILATSRSSTARPELPDEDVRTRIDESVRRVWREFARRIGRRALLVSFDIVAAALAMGVALTWAAPGMLGSQPGLRAALPLIVPAVILQPLLFQAVGAYRDGTNRASLRRVPLGVALTAVLAWLETTLTGTAATAVLYLHYTILATLAVLAGRATASSLLSLAHNAGLGQRRVIVIGATDDGGLFWRNETPAFGSGMSVVGRIAYAPPFNGNAAAVHRELERSVRERRADGVVIAARMPFQEFESLVERCFALGASVTVLPHVIQRIGQNRLVMNRTEVGSLMEVTPKGLRVPQLAIKRAMDIVLTSAGLIFVAPIMLVIAIAIKLDSRGPVFFSQIRAGVGGRPFRMYKFRTMIADADRMKAQLQHLNESGDPRLFKIKNDPRVTRVGRILRKTSLDELPQLFNVLKGEMSLVGPRPFFPGDLDDYEAHHFERLHVLPGITGLWQVNGRSDVVDFEEVVRLDTEYIRNWSIRMDVGILLRTLPAAFGRGGAY